MYTWAANKLKLARSVSFVNVSLGEQKVSDEIREKMIKEYYQQIGGLILKLDSQSSATMQQLTCNECGYIARKESGLAIHKGKEHPNV